MNRVLALLLVGMAACGDFPAACRGDDPPIPTSGSAVRSQGVAQNLVDFPIIQPGGLGSPQAIFVYSGDPVQEVTFIYDTDRFGRIEVSEIRWPVLHSKYYSGQDTAVRRSDDELGCGTARIVRIRGGRRALVTESEDGAGISWLERSILEIKVRGGPALSATNAISVAQGL